MNMTEEFFEFKKFDGEIYLDRHKTRGVLMFIMIESSEKDLLLRIARKLNRLDYYLVFVVERTINRYFFVCRLDDIHVRGEGGRLLMVDMYGTALDPNEYKKMEELFGIWEGMSWETIHGIIVQGTNPEDVRNFGYAYLTLNEENKTPG